MKRWLSGLQDTAHQLHTDNFVLVRVADGALSPFLRRMLLGAADLWGVRACVRE